MDKTTNIIVTGAAGFIGSCLVGFLNEKGFSNLILVDEFSRADKTPNLAGKNYIEKIERESLFDQLSEGKLGDIGFIFHIGARTDTTEFDYSVHQHLNVDYSIKIWEYCTKHRIPLVYASSAATYGGGEFGYEDSHEVVWKLKPLNPYGISKNEFDKWALQQDQEPPAWFGLKFFNVYGPNEYHKARMASVIFHSFNQIRQSGKVKLFKSHRPDFEDGKQLRDFIYVKDILKVCYWLMIQATTNLDEQSPRASQISSGIFNLGTGKARSFEDLVKATFSALDLQPKIEFIDMPEDIRDKYQYFTEADMTKLKVSGYQEAFYSLENGIDDYVRNYLSQGIFY